MEAPEIQVEVQEDGPRQIRRKPVDPIKAERTAEAARNLRMKTEIFDFPVFKMGEPMPLKYYVHADILGSIISRRQSAGEVITPEIKAEIKAAIQRQLKKYCREDAYRMAAVIRQKRYKLNGEEAEKISDKDMHGFIALVRAAERRKTEADKGETK